MFIEILNLVKQIPEQNGLGCFTLARIPQKMVSDSDHSAFHTV